MMKLSHFFFLILIPVLYSCSSDEHYLDFTIETQDIKIAKAFWGSKYVSAELSEENQRQFFIPRGFAHGFLVLSEEAIFIYKVDNAYVPQAEASIRFNDETIGIEWPIAEEQLLLSPKDKTAPSFRDATYFE